jgi:hypothetical protein
VRRRDRVDPRPALIEGICKCQPNTGSAAPRTIADGSLKEDREWLPSPTPRDQDGCNSDSAFPEYRDTERALSSSFVDRGSHRPGGTKTAGHIRKVLVRTRTRPAGEHCQPTLRHKKFWSWASGDASQG